MNVNALPVLFLSDEIRKKMKHAVKAIEIYVCQFFRRSLTPKICLSLWELEHLSYDPRICVSKHCVLYEFTRICLTHFVEWLSVSDTLLHCIKARPYMAVNIRTTKPAAVVYFAGVNCLFE